MGRYGTPLAETCGRCSAINVTDVRVRRLNSDSKMKAVASITIDQDFVVHDVRVVEGPNGLFVAMPSRKTADGEYRDVAHPITADAREVISETVLKAYGDMPAGR